MLKKNPDRSGDEAADRSVPPVAGKRTRSAGLAVQRRGGSTATPDVHAAAERGVAGPSQSLPFLDVIQTSFGPGHDLTRVQAHVGGPAADAAADMGATAFATGDHVAFAAPPDLHTTAHEAAHVVQQTRGVNLRGGVGQADDTYERHADQVADAVVGGQSAAALLGPSGASAGQAVQRRVVKAAGGAGDGGAVPVEGAEAAPAQYYASADELLADVAHRYPVIATFFERDPGARESALATVAPLLEDGGNHTLAEVARALTPSLMVGEAHHKQGARDFITGNLGDLHALGITVLVIEFAGGDSPYGDFLKEAVVDQCITDPAERAQVAPDVAAIDDGWTFEQCVEYLADTPSLNRLLVTIFTKFGNTGGAAGGHGAGIAQVVIAARAAGFRIKCGDYTKFMDDPSSTSNMKKRNATFARTMHATAEQGQKSVLLIGSFHLTKANPVQATLGALGTRHWWADMSK